ncbi:hypothetical protein LINGRAHAP2_LOCUS13994, partial [Linum grandiflorum]
MFMAIADLSEEDIQATASSEVCFRSQIDSSEWVLDSGCSHHMTGNRALFCSLQNRDKGNVRFGDNRPSKILGIGKIGT